MTTPRKAEIIAKATELFHHERFKNGDPSFDIEPELNELRESGFLSAARSSLMTSVERKNEQWLKKTESVENLADFQFDIKEAMQTTCFISGSRGVGKSDIAMRIAQELQNDGIIIITFDPSCDWLKRSSIEQYFTVKPFSNLPIPACSTIFDLSRLTPIEMRQCVEGFSKKLFDCQVDNSEKNFYLVFEEAQIYFPLSALSSKNTQNTMRLLTVGRNFDVSLAAISQFPALVSKELVKHSQQIWIGCCAEPNTLKYWHGLIGKYSEKLRQLSNGEFIYYCRNKIGKIQIEPFENNTVKTRIVLPEPNSVEPIKPKEQISVVPLLRLGVILGFAILLIGAIRR